MFKEITLPFEARVGASLFLNSPRQGQTMAELRKAHEIHQQFELDFVEEWIEKNVPGGLLVFSAIERAQIEPIRVRLDESHLNIPAHQFAAALRAVHRGAHSVAQVKTVFGMREPEDTDEFDAWLARINAKGTELEKHLACHAVEDILLWWEMGDVSGYSTVEEIRQKLVAI